MNLSRNIPLSSSHAWLQKSLEDPQETLLVGLLQGLTVQSSIWRQRWSLPPSRCSRTLRTRQLGKLCLYYLLQRARYRFKLKMFVALLNLSVRVYKDAEASILGVRGPEVLTQRNIEPVLGSSSARNPDP